VTSYLGPNYLLVHCWTHYLCFAGIGIIDQSKPRSRLHLRIDVCIVANASSPAFELLQDHLVGQALSGRHLIASQAALRIILRSTASARRVRIIDYDDSPNSSPTSDPQSSCGPQSRVSDSKFILPNKLRPWLAREGPSLRQRGSNLPLIRSTKRTFCLKARRLCLLFPRFGRVHRLRLRRILRWLRSVDAMVQDLYFPVVGLVGDALTTSLAIVVNIL
jgi:hypothetical protein